MGKLWALALTALAATVAESAVAQSNNNDCTPLNSRIRRDRQFPLDLPNRFDPERSTRFMRERSKDMLGQLARRLAAWLTPTISSTPRSARRTRRSRSSPSRPR